MRIGTTLPQMGPLAEPHRVAEFARGAEDMGYEALWAADRVLTPLHADPPYPGFTPENPWPPEQARFADPLVTLSAAAVATSRVRLSTSVLVATLHHPVLLARTFTSLDLLSEGRFDAGLGIGWMRTEYQTLGVPWEKRGERLDEILDALQAIWTTNPAEHSGRLWTIPPSQVDLRPARPAGPPVLLAGFSPGAMERIGRRADGWLPVMATDDQPLAALDPLWELACAAATTAGRDPDTLRRELRINLNPGQTVDDAVPVLHAAREAGYSGTFFELAYISKGIDHALELAQRAIELYRRG